MDILSGLCLVIAIGWRELDRYKAAERERLITEVKNHFGRFVDMLEADNNRLRGTLREYAKANDVRARIIVQQRKRLAAFEQARTAGGS